MGSSGIYADSYESVEYCGWVDAEEETCYFEGEVEVYFDPEAGYATWQCPLCNHHHEFPWP